MCMVPENALKRMHRQVGELVFDENGLAQRGLLLRHLSLFPVRVGHIPQNPGCFSTQLNKDYADKLGGTSSFPKEFARKPYLEDLS